MPKLVYIIIQKVYSPNKLNNILIESHIRENYKLFSGFLHYLKFWLTLLDGEIEDSDLWNTKLKFKFKFFLLPKKIYIEYQNILTAIYDQDWSVNLPSGSRQGRLC